MAGCDITRVPMKAYGSLPVVQMEIDLPECNIPKNVYNLVLDTGSSFSYLNPKYCHSGALKKDRLSLKSVSGEKEQSMDYTLATFTRPGLAGSSFKMYFHEFSALTRVDGILGNNSFAGSIVIAGFPEKLGFLNSPGCLKNRMYPYKHEGYQIGVPVAIGGGEQQEMILDSGASYSYMDKIPAGGCSKQTKKQFYDGFTGMEFKGTLCQLDNVCVYGQCAAKLDFLIPDGRYSGFSKRGILGLNFLKQYYVIIDYTTHQTGLIPGN